MKTIKVFGHRGDSIGASYITYPPLDGNIAGAGHYVSIADSVVDVVKKGYKLLFPSSPFQLGFYQQEYIIDQIELAV